MMKATLKGMLIANAEPIRATKITTPRKIFMDFLNLGFVFLILSLKPFAMGKIAKMIL